MRFPREIKFDPGILAKYALLGPPREGLHILGWLTSTILTARRQLSWPVEAGDDFNPLLA
jgi:hypothetical protein